VRVLRWHLIALSASAQTDTVVAGTLGEGAALASVRTVGVGLINHCRGGYKHVRALFWPLFGLSAWA
jgi:hypothetical protein